MEEGGVSARVGWRDGEKGHTDTHFKSGLVIMLSEISQTVRDKYHYDLTFNWNIINRRKKQTKYNQRH